MAIKSSLRRYAVTYSNLSKKQSLYVSVCIANKTTVGILFVGAGIVKPPRIENILVLTSVNLRDDYRMIRIIK